MQNFKSKDKAITVDTLFKGFKSIMQNAETYTLVATGKFASVEVSEGVSIVVYGSEEKGYLVEAFVTVDGRTKNLAWADFDLYDI